MVPRLYDGYNPHGGSEPGGFIGIGLRTSAFQAAHPEGQSLRAEQFLVARIVPLTGHAGEGRGAQGERGRPWTPRHEPT